MQNFIQIYSKTHQIASLNKNSGGGGMSPSPYQARATRPVLTQVGTRPPSKSCIRMSKKPPSGGGP